MTKEKKKNWQGVTGGKKLGQKALLVLFLLTNVTVGYFFLALVVPFYMLFRKKPCGIIFRYFRKSFGYSSVKSFLKTYQNHFVFGQCLLDRFAVYAGRKNLFNLTFTGNEEFYKLIDEEKGFIMASSHVGNFELCGYLLKQDKKQIHALVFGGETKEIMENRMKLFKMNNVSLIPVYGDFSHIFELHAALSHGEIVSMPCDRNFGSAKSVECDFLSGKANFPIGAFALSAHFDVPVLSVFVMKESAFHYHLYVKPIMVTNSTNLSKKEKAEMLTRAFAKELEDIVRKYPAQWFNFYNFWK